VLIVLSADALMLIVEKNPDTGSEKINAFGGI
jgi:hypothetical protein